VELGLVQLDVRKTGTEIYFYNTLTRKKEKFIPLVVGKAGVYSCGPTVYWNAHIGHMYAFVVWDVMVRFLRWMGYEVNHVMNITDVGHMTNEDEGTGEDKMEKGARREGLTVWEVAKKYEKQFFESERLLNIIRPNVISRATDHIEEQIELAKKIEKNGFAYKTETGLVFDTGKFKDYAKFSGKKLEEQEMGLRVEVDKEKKKPWDFLLWVTNQPKHTMIWDSPWGKGFPGWHLECTAMSVKYLGENFDIHTGGMEHISVHHSNEIAQAYGAFGKQTSNYWLHNGWLNLKGEKMSKSLGNVCTVLDLVKKGYDPLALRYLVLSSHYRKGLIFSLESLDAAQKTLDKLRRAVESWRKESGEKKGKISGEWKDKFIKALSDDMSSPELLALVWGMVKADLLSRDKLATLLDLDEVLGLDLKTSREGKTPQEVIDLGEERVRARKKGDYKKADEIREKISELGYTVKDKESGYEFLKKKRVIVKKRKKC